MSDEPLPALPNATARPADIRKITFLDCTKKFIEKEFAIKRLWQMPELDAWTSSLADIAPEERLRLLALQDKLFHRVDAWNEYELVTHFIGPLLSLVDFDTGKFNLFGQRDLRAIVGGWELSGCPDGLVAVGSYDPETPYFCLHEYKREIAGSSDPGGQLLGAMLVARQLNGSPARPVYGCYVIGRLWFFAVLRGNEYALSRDYSATDAEEILDIFRILRSLKAMLLASADGYTAAQGER
jgi:hypothetical protein